MATVVKSVRLKEEIWETLRRLSKEEGRPLSHLLNEAIEEYVAERTKQKAVERLRKLPRLSLGGKPLSREEIYDGRY